MKFGMYVYCKRDGISRDSGLHITLDADTIEESKKSPRIYEELTWPYGRYDSVRYEIKAMEE